MSRNILTMYNLNSFERRSFSLIFQYITQTFKLACKDEPKKHCNNSVCPLKQCGYVWKQDTEKEQEERCPSIQTKTRKRTSKLMLTVVAEAEARNQMMNHQTQVESFCHHVLRYFRMLIKHLLQDISPLSSLQSHFSTCARSLSTTVFLRLYSG